jgi:hypothetical protein
VVRCGERTLNLTMKAGESATLNTALQRRS